MQFGTSRVLALTVFMAGLTPSIDDAYARGSFVSNFAQGFFQGGNAKAQQEQRQQQATSQADFDAVMSDLQAERRLKEQHQQEQLNRAVQQLNEQDIPQCANETVTRRNAVRISTCVSNAYISRYSEGGYPYMSLVRTYAKENELLAGEYANGQITIDQFGARLQRAHEKWMQANQQELQQTNVEQTRALTDRANHEAEIMYTGQQQTRRQQNEIEQLKQRVSDAESENARHTYSDAGDGGQQKRQETDFTFQQQQQQQEIDRLERANKRMEAEQPLFPK